jgi:hypothetical protein
MWDDLEDAMSGCVNWQSANRGKIIPLLFFAPMTAPANPDAWEPLQGPPQNLFIISIEYSSDATLRRAIRHASGVLGDLREPDNCPHVDIALDGHPIAEVYAQMEAAGITAYRYSSLLKDDLSFFFIRGPEAVQAFSQGLRRATARK